MSAVCSKRLHHLKDDDEKCVGLHRTVDVGLRISEFKVEHQLLSIDFRYLSGPHFPHFLWNGDGSDAVS